MTKKSRPPLGITPRKFHEEYRISEILSAVVRYMNAKYKIPIEWIQEYNDLVKNVKDE